MTQRDNLQIFISWYILRKHRSRNTERSKFFPHQTDVKLETFASVIKRTCESTSIRFFQQNRRIVDISRLATRESFRRTSIMRELVKELPSALSSWTRSSETIRELSADVLAPTKHGSCSECEKSSRSGRGPECISVLFARHQLHTVVRWSVKPSNVRQWTNRRWVQQRKCVWVAVWKISIEIQCFYQNGVI